MTPPLGYARRETPLRTILFSSYYDATATTKEQDYGNFSAILSEDFYFSSSLRVVALGRLRREVRNNPYLAGLVAKFPEAVGYAALRSTSSDRAYNVRKQRWWQRLARRLTSAGDSLRTLEKIVKLEMLFAGELFLVARRDGTVQVIPSEYCGSPAVPGAETAAADGGREVNGIRYDAAGTVVGYRFGRLNAAGILSFDTTVVVPAAQVIHIFDKDRVMLGRGLPWLLPSLRTARDLYEITRSKTKQIKDANSLSGFIEKQGAADFLRGLDGPLAGPEAPAPEAPSAPADKPAPAGPVVVELKPGTFIALEPGEKISSLMSHYNATDYKELIMLMLHAMSSPVGLPVELWFSGLGDVNYSGYKGLGVQWDGRRLDVIEFLQSSFYDPLYLWRVGKATAEDELPAHPDGDEHAVEWVFRRTPILDDEKAGKANKTKLESGETDLAEIWAEKGYTEEEVFTRRRQLWIKAQIAAGELEEGADHSAVKVPVDFLLRNELPGETTVPHIPDPAERQAEAAEAATAATAAAESAGAAAAEARAAVESIVAALARIEALTAGIRRAA